VASWLALAKKSRRRRRPAGVDLTVARLRLMGSEFGSTRLLISPMANGMTVRAQGDRLDGQVSIPDAENAAISAVFKTVHLAAVGVKTAEKAAVPVSAPIDFGNPAECRRSAQYSGPAIGGFGLADVTADRAWRARPGFRASTRSPP
jgi:uncharacterized protein YhdP